MKAVFLKDVGTSVFYLRLNSKKAYCLSTFKLKDDSSLLVAELFSNNYRVLGQYRVVYIK